MKNIILFASIIVASGLLLTNIYTSIVDAKSWGSTIPDSIKTARAYYQSANPGDFFRIFSPINQIFGLLALILCWKTSPTIRLYLGIAFIMYIVGDVMTFAYFYPRNEVLFKTAQLTDVELLKKTWSEWNNMNWVRSLVVVIGLVFSCLSLHKIYTLK